jgi:hypothetical protein
LSPARSRKSMMKKSSNKTLAQNHRLSSGNKPNNIKSIHCAVVTSLAQIAAPRDKKAVKRPILLLFDTDKKMISR